MVKKLANKGIYKSSIFLDGLLFTPDSSIKINNYDINKEEVLTALWLNWLLLFYIYMIGGFVYARIIWKRN